MAQPPEELSGDLPEQQPDIALSPNLNVKNNEHPDMVAARVLIALFKQIEAAGFVFNRPATSQAGDYPARTPAVIEFPFEAEDWLAVTPSRYGWQFELREPEENVWRCVFVHSKESLPRPPKEIFILTVVQSLDGVDSKNTSDQTGSTTLHAHQVGAPSSRDFREKMRIHNGSAGTNPKSGTPLHPHC